eukprot:9996480-Alexandrium_andersonii.AAC.1
MNGASPGLPGSLRSARVAARAASPEYVPDLCRGRGMHRGRNSALLYSNGSAGKPTCFTKEDAQ